MKNFFKIALVLIVGTSLGFGLTVGASSVFQIFQGGTGLSSVGASSTVMTTDGSVMKWNKLATSQITNDSGFLSGIVGLTNGGTGTTTGISNQNLNWLSNGVTSGMTISVNTDTTKFNISSGTGYIVDNSTPSAPSFFPMTYAGSTANVATYLASADATYIAIDRTGAIIQSTTDFTPTQRRSYIILGAIVHSNRTSISASNNRPDVVRDGIDQLNDFMVALQNFNMSGNVFTANGSNMNINKSSGVEFKKGSNFKNDPTNPHQVTLAALTPASFDYYTQNGRYTSTATTTIDAAHYDNAGTVTAVPSTKWTVQTIYISSGNAVVIQYGQKLYSTKSAAISGVASDPTVVETNIGANFLLRAVLIVKGTATNLSSSAQAVFSTPDKFGNITSVATGAATTNLQQAYDNSAQPQILTSATGGAIQFQQGSGADTDHVFDILNGAGGITSSFLGNGTLGVGTSTPTSVLSVQGNGYFSGTLFVGGPLTSTSTLASLFPYASTTAVSAASYFGTGLSGLLAGGTNGLIQNAVSGTNIKTVNSTSLLGSGDVAVQPTLVSGTNIKTVFGTSLLGSGDVSTTTLSNNNTWSGTNIFGTLGAGNTWQGTAVADAYIASAQNWNTAYNRGYPFTFSTNYGVTNAATGTPIWAQAGINASSTSNFVYASTTALSASSLFGTGLSGLLAGGTNGLVKNAVSGTDIKTVNGNSLLGSGNITVAGSGASTTLLASDNNTFSGITTFIQNIVGNLTGNASTATKLAATKNINTVPFDGSADITITAASSTLLSNNNTWSGNNTFNGTLTGTLTGNATNVTGTVALGNGGTGATSFNSGWIYKNGASYLQASTSPTVNWVTATSTSNASTFPYASTTALTVSGNSYLGTVSSGTWNGSTLGVAYGGTASTTLGGILAGNGTSAVKSAAIGSGLTWDGTTLAASGGGGSASTTLLADNNTWSGANNFMGALTGPAGLFGSGFDGASTTSGTVTLSRNMYFTKLTVAGGTTINTNGYSIFVTGILDNAGTIANNGTNGGNGSGTTHGSGGVGGKISQSTLNMAGGNGADASCGTPLSIVGSNGTNITGIGVSGTYGGAGGSSGAGIYQGGAATTRGILTSTAFSDTFASINTFASSTISNTSFGIFGYATSTTIWASAGSGGGSAGGNENNKCSGPGGGAGGTGGIVEIASNNFINTGTISSNGGNGGNGGDATQSASGGGGGGGGGSGGAVILFYHTLTDSGTISVAGGTGGTGGNGVGGGNTGAGGGTGITGSIFKIIL